MDVEKLMPQADDDKAHTNLSRAYRPTMRNGDLQKGAAAAASNYEDVGNGNSGKPLRFSTGVEVFTRPMTLQKDKQTLHYTRQELFKMQQDAEEEDEAFSIVGVKVESGVVMYGIRWLDEEDGAIEWIKRQAVYEAGPTMLCEYESIHNEELMLMNSKIKEVLEAENKKRADAERLKQEREKVLASAKAKAQAELRELEGSDEAANAEDNSAAGATAAAS